MKDEMGEACGMYGVKETCIQVLVKKCEEQKSFGRTEHRGEKNIQWIFKKLAWDIEWIVLA
jgi:hypothetical protein